MIPIRAANRRRKKVVNAAGENEREKESEREKKRGEAPVLENFPVA